MHLVVSVGCIMYGRTICRCIALKINIKYVIAFVNDVTIFSTQLALWTISRDKMLSLSSTTKWISPSLGPFLFWKKLNLLLCLLLLLFLCWEVAIFALTRSLSGTVFWRHNRCSRVRRILWTEWSERSSSCYIREATMEL